jgi:copper(I)-binding protein
MRKQLFGVAVATCFFAPAIVRAQETKAGDLTIAQPWSRATPKGAQVGAAYLTIRNGGAAADRLTGATSDTVGEAQVHEMSMTDGVMKMRELPKGLEIPAGGSVELKPNSYHLMLMKLKKPLEKGDTLHLTLSFDRAGKVPVDFKIGGVGDMGPAGADAGGTKMNAPMKMDGGMKMDH